MLRKVCNPMRLTRTPAQRPGCNAPSTPRITSPPALRSDMISNALNVFAIARTDTAAMTKENSVPLIQNISQPIFEGAWPKWSCALAPRGACSAASAAVSARTGSTMVIEISERSCGHKRTAYSTHPVPRN